MAIITLAIFLGSVVTMIKGWLSLAWYPHLVEWIATKDPSFYLPKIQWSLNTFSIVFFVLACLATLWTEPVIQWIYPEFYLPAAAIIPIYFLAGSFSVLTFIANPTVLIASKPAYYLPILSGGLIINVVTGVILIPKIGILGAALGTLLAEVSVLCLWIIVGLGIIKNLSLNWLLALVFGSFASIFIYFYEPGVFLAGWNYTERILVTFVLIGSVAYYHKRVGILIE